MTGEPNPRDHPAEVSVMDLAARSRALIDFERCWWAEAGEKSDLILERFGLIEPEYDAMLTDVIDEGAALAYDPLVVRRLRRERAQRGAMSHEEQGR